MGPVIGVQELQVENRYQVFMEGAPKWFYESQLDGVASQGESHALVSLDHFHAHLTALQLQHPSLSTLYSLNAARVDFIPYQFRPVLKFIRADRPRLLIADSVGVGKTIEAGLILRELQARREVRSVLVICPRPLVTERKWLMEMKRFEERFTQLDGNTRVIAFPKQTLRVSGLSSMPKQYFLTRCLMKYYFMGPRRPVPRAARKDNEVYWTSIPHRASTW